MSQPVKPGAPNANITSALDGPERLPYRRVYAWVFQAWLVMFLGVICAALVFYLLSYIPK